MWGKDDQIRELLKDLSVALREADTTVAEWKLLAATTGAAAANSVHEMIYKEEQILFPICLERFTADDWAEIGRAHGEVFGEIRPASAMLVITGLLDPRFLVEIEADAIVSKD
jgi:DUF438 domain-containing protein